MEFIEAQYRAVQEELGTNPELGDFMPGTGGFRKMLGRMRGAVRVAELGCELSIATSSRIIRYG